MRVVAILLAAGSSTRFGADKLLAPYRGRPLYQHALSALCACPRVEQVLVVVRPAFPAPPDAGGCRWVVNPEPGEGLGSSLRVGVAAAPPGADALLVALADMPHLSAHGITALIDFAAASTRPIAAPAFRGRRGHPVLFRAELKSLLLQAQGDAGAREILREHPEMVGLLETDDPSVVFDVDLPSDLEAAP